MDKRGNKEVLCNEFVLGTVILFPGMTVCTDSWSMDFQLFHAPGKGVLAPRSYFLLRSSSNVSESILDPQKHIIDRRTMDPCFYD